MKKNISGFAVPEKLQICSGLQKKHVLAKSCKEFLGKVAANLPDELGDVSTLAKLGLNRTSRPVRKSGKLSKSGLSGNRTFSFPDAGLLKIGKKKKKKKKIIPSLLRNNHDSRMMLHVFFLIVVSFLFCFLLFSSLRDLNMVKG